MRVARRRAPDPRRKWLLAASLVLMAAALTLAYLQTWPPLATVMSAQHGADDRHRRRRGAQASLERPARVGDIVSIPVPDEARSRFGYPPVVIHRVVGIDAAGIVSTQGRRPQGARPLHGPATALTTRVVATVPAAGRALAFLGSPLGLLWLVGGAALLIGMPLVERYRDAQRRVAAIATACRPRWSRSRRSLIALRADRSGRTGLRRRAGAAAAEAQPPPDGERERPPPRARQLAR